MIELERLSKHFDGLAAVDGVSARFETGTVTAVVGTSGSGKTTLLRMINRLIEPDSGRVLIDGQDIRALSPVALRRGIGYAIQGHGLFPHWTAARNIAVVPRLLGWPRERITARVAELLALLQLDPAEIGPRYPHQLSGGQAQRIGVARALAARPGVLLMDEPFGALDPVTRRQAQKDFAAIQRKLGTTVVLVTHDMAEALLLGDRIAVMRAGRFEQLAAPARIVKSPATPFVAEMVGEEGRALLLLSLMPAAALLRRGAAPSAAPRLAAGASLSEALSQMLWSGAEVLAVTDEAGPPQGVLRRDDILAAARQEGAEAAGPARPWAERADHERRQAARAGGQPAGTEPDGASPGGGGPRPVPADIAGPGAGEAGVGEPGGDGPDGHGPGAGARGADYAAAEDGAGEAGSGSGGRGPDAGAPGTGHAAADDGAGDEVGSGSGGRGPGAGASRARRRVANEADGSGAGGPRAGGPGDGSPGRDGPDTGERDAGAAGALHPEPAGAGRQGVDVAGAGEAGAGAGGAGEAGAGEAGAGGAGAAEAGRQGAGPTGAGGKGGAC